MLQIKTCSLSIGPTSSGSHSRDLMQLLLWITIVWWIRWSSTILKLYIRHEIMTSISPGLKNLSKLPPWGYCILHTISILLWLQLRAVRERDSHWLSWLIVPHKNERVSVWPHKCTAGNAAKPCGKPVQMSWSYYKLQRVGRHQMD